MLSCLGVGHHTLSHFYDRAKTVCDPLNKDISINNTLDKSDVVLVQGFNNFKRAKDILAKQKKHVVVFDSTLLLDNIPGIIPLDYDPTDKSYTFSLKKLDWSTFVKAVKRSKKNISIDISEIDHIATVIERSRSGAFLDRYNTFTTNLSKDKQTLAKKTILSYLFGKITKKEYDEKSVVFVPTRKSKLLDFYNDLKVCLDGEDGAKVILALKEIVDFKEKNPKKTVNWKMVAKKHLVDAYELRYLMEAWRKTNGIKEGFDLGSALGKSTSKANLPKHKKAKVKK